MGTVHALNGYQLTLTNGKVNIWVDYNYDTGKVVRCLSPYHNHHSMIGKDIHNVVPTLLTAGWKEVGRETWKCIYATSAPSVTVTKHPNE